MSHLLSRRLAKWFPSFSPARQYEADDLRRRFRPSLERLEVREVPVSRLELSGFGAAVAGAAQTLTVRAINANGSVDDGYAGTIHFGSSDARALQLSGLPADYNFLPGDLGVHTFPVTFYTAGTQTLTAADTGDPAIHGTLTASQTAPVFTQPPDPAGGFYKSAWYSPGGQGLDGDQYVWDDFTLNTTQSINEVDWRGCYTNYLSGAGQSPVSDFTISIYGSIAAGIQPDVINPPLMQYTVGGNAGETPAGVVGGVQMYDYHFQLPVPFQAQAGTKYWVQIEASQGVTPFYGWPPDWSIAAGTGGDQSHYIMITGGTNGGGNLYRSMAGDAAFTLATTTSSSGVLVSPAATSQLVVSAPASVTVGVPASVTVTAQDAFGNVTPGYAGTIHFASTDPQAGLPAEYTFAPGDQGVHPAALTFNTVGVWRVDATDTVAVPPVTGQSANIVANPPVTLGALSFGQWTATWAGYSAHIAVGGGTGSYGNLVVTGLPAGLRAAVAGNLITLGGTPSSAGTYPYTVTLTDSAGASTTQSYSMTVFPATTLAWTGLGGDNFWNDAANWTGAAPTSGSTLVFSAGAPQKTNVNNFPANTAFAALVFQDPGYSVTGNAIKLSGGITALATGSGTDILALNISLTGNQTIAVDGPGETLQLSGVISGAGFGVTKTGAGTLLYSGAAGNTYSGATTVTNGLLKLDKNSGNALAGTLNVTGGRVIFGTHDNQIADKAAVSLTGTALDLVGRSDKIGTLTLTGGSVTTGAGALTLGGNVTVNAASGEATISGNFNLGGTTRTFTVADGGATEDLVISAAVSNGGITKAGPGALELSGTNSYAGATTVNAGVLDARNASALGTAKAGTTVAAGATLELESETNQNFAEPLTLGSSKGGATLLMLGGTNTWSGKMALPARSTVNVGSGQLTLSGAISGAGGLTKVGDGTLAFTGSSANAYKGATTVSSGRLTLDKAAGAAVAGALTVGSGAAVGFGTHDNQIADASMVTVGAGATLDLNGRSDKVGGLTLSGGTVSTGAGTLTLGGNITSNAAGLTANITGNLNLGGKNRTVSVGDGAADPDLIIAAALSGGSLSKTGLGQLILNGQAL